MAVLITMFYMAGAVKTTTPGRLGGREVDLSYLLGEKKIVLLLLSEAQDDFYVIYCLNYYNEKSLSSLLP